MGGSSRIHRTDLGDRQRHQLFTSGSEHRLDREPPLELGQELVLHRRVDERRHQSVQLAGLSRRELQDGLLGLPRSEEHTSELQSLMRNSYSVFCLTQHKFFYTVVYDSY